MPHYCPKKEQRIYPEVCKALCPNDWERRLMMEGEGLIFCTFKTKKMNQIETQKEIRRFKLQKRKTNGKSLCSI